MSINNGLTEKSEKQTRLNTEVDGGGRSEQMVLSEDEETEAQKKQRRLENAGPPSFYEADIERYKRKFDGSLKLRN